MLRSMLLKGLFSEGRDHHCEFATWSAGMYDFKWKKGPRFNVNLVSFHFFLLLVLYFLLLVKAEQLEHIHRMLLRDIRMEVRTPPPRPHPKKFWVHEVRSLENRMLDVMLRWSHCFIGQTYKQLMPFPVWFPWQATGWIDFSEAFRIVLTFSDVQYTNCLSLFFF